MLKDIIDVLADPVDGTPLSGPDDRGCLVSHSGHSYDIAPEGYVTLSGGEGLKHHGDDPRMIADRETFLSRGHFAPFVEAVTNVISDVFNDAGIPDEAEPVICEIGAGTGYYLAHSLDSIVGARGVGLDVSVAAAKHLAACHSRVGSVVADACYRLPLRDASVDAITVIFAPRNAEEFARVLKPGGEVIVLTADPGHLAELREPLGIIDVERGKVERLIEQARGYLAPVAESEHVEFTMELDQESIAAQVGMSPSARHIEPEELSRRVAALPDTMRVSARATVTRLRRTADPR